MLPAPAFVAWRDRDPAGPEEPDRPRRRALLFGIAFAGGAALGFWLAFPSAPAAAAPVPVVDPIVAWVREIARSPARVRELNEHYHGLLLAIEVVPDDPLVWQGFRQVVDYMAEVPPEPQTQLQARALRDTLEVHKPHLDDYAALLARLQLLSGTRPR